MALHVLGRSGTLVLAILGEWLLVSIPHQLGNRYGAWVKRINLFALIPGWTFFAPTPGTSDYRFVFRDRVADGEQHRQVRVAVGVRPALGEVDVVRGGEPLHRLDLERPVGVEVHLPGVAAIIREQGLAGHDVVDAGQTPDRPDDLLG